MKRLVFAIVAVGLMACHGSAPARQPAGPSVLDSFKPPYLSAKFAGQQYTIYESKSDGPAVVILHEGPGMLYEDIRFGQIVASKGFKVYMPLMFGKVGERSNTNLLRACTRAGFHCFRNRPAAILDWLHPFVDSVSRGKPAAVIGMCLSGNVPLAMLDDPNVRVAVMSQPALPMNSKAALGVTDAQVSAARAAIKKGAALLYFRFKADTISPQQRLDAFKKLIPEIEERQLPSARHGAHSVLGLEYCDDPTDPSYQAAQRTIAVLKERLGT